jgi:hypothetical protein
LRDLPVTAASNFLGRERSVAVITTMASVLLTWQPFYSLPSDAEAAFASRFCLFSLASLEVMSDSPSGAVALVEQEHPDAWRWILVGPDDFIVDGGTEPTQAQAKQAAEAALRFQTSSVPAAEKALLVNLRIGAAPLAHRVT